MLNETLRGTLPTRREAALAMVAGWLTFMAAVVVGGGLETIASFVLASAVGAALVFLGFAAASRCRTLPRRLNVQRTRLALLSLAVGAACGLANLAANWAIAAADPRLRTLLIERMVTLEPLEALVASPVMEEVAVRLFLMSAMAWVVSRFTKRLGAAFAIALLGSACVFALLHLSRPLPDDSMLANNYWTALLTKYTLAGVPLGWIFWRWGLPYSILRHVAANAAHLALQDRVF